MPENAANHQLTCFVIGPIGNKLAPPGTDSRSVYEDSIQMWEEVFQPAAEELGMTPIRADKISQPGEIPEQIFTLLRDADVVIADLTGGNANVMYELGLRHTRGRLTVQVGEYARLPFDVNTIRTIQFRRTESGLIEARRSVVEAVRSGLEDGARPVTAARLWQEGDDGGSAVVAQAILTTLAPLETQDDEIPPEPGYMDILADGELAVGQIADVLARSTAAVEAIGAVMQDSTERLERSDSSGKGFAGRLRVATELADAMREPTDEFEASSSDYVRLLQTADLSVNYLIGSVEGGDNSLEEMREFFESVVEFADTTIRNEAALTEFRQANSNTAKIASVLQPVTRRLDRSILRFLSGIVVMRAWRTRILALPGWERPSAAEGT